MAQAIANIPVLEGREAEAFVKTAKKNLDRKGSVDMTQAIKSMRELLAKSKKLGYL